MAALPPAMTLMRILLEDVAADRPVDVAPDGPPARPRLLGDQRVAAGTQFLPSSSMKKVMNVTVVTVATTMVTTLLVIDSAVPLKPNSFDAPPSSSAVLDPLDDVVLRLQESEPPLALGEVVDVVGDLVDQVIHLIDERRDEDVGD